MSVKDWNALDTVKYFKEAYSKQDEIEKEKVIEALKIIESKLEEEK